MRTFQELLVRYKIQVDQYAKENGLFKESETDVDARKDTQNKLISGFQAKPILGYSRPKPDQIEAQNKIRQRISLYQQQLKYTQGMQELELQKQEMTFLFSELKDDKVKFDKGAALDANAKAQEDLEKLLSGIELQIKQLAKQKEQQRIIELNKYASKIKLPAKIEDYKTSADVQNALLVQQKRAIELANATAENDVWQKEFEKDKKIKAAWLQKMSAYVQTQKNTLITAYHLLASSGLLDETKKGITLYGDKPLGDRGQAQDKTLNRLQEMLQKALLPKTATEGLAQLDPVFMADLNGSAAITQKIVTDTQDAVQIILTNKMKAGEKAKQNQAGYKTLQRYMTADADKEPSEYLAKLLKDPTRNVLKGLVAASKDSNELSQVINAHKDKDKLAEYQRKLMQVIENQVVQGPFLLDKKNLLVMDKSNDGDDEFFELTNSANGGYNDPKNLGKYTYHVTALANILRTVDSGIGVTGLSPGLGGKLGGSCEIADTKKDFSNTGVDIKTGSVVNSQNKVAASSNRNDAMKVYIKQREDHVADIMKESRLARNGKDTATEDAKAKQAAKDTAVMLRFPIRAEYLGKFTDDPMHLTANLELLDGTPVPPKDIECLVHKQWIGITNSDFVKTYKEMFGIT